MKNLNLPITTSLLKSKLKLETLPHPEYPEENFTKIEFFANDLSILPILIQEINSELDTNYDFEINPSIFYNCDDQNYLITTEVYQY